MRLKADAKYVRNTTILNAPAVQALFIQCASLALVLLTLYLLFVLCGIQSTVATAIFLQAVSATIITYKRALASWWLAIQFFFPLALAATFALHLPPIIFFILFLFLLVVYWTTFRTQVPFYPSGPIAWDLIAKALPQEREIKFIDIGSGLGDLIFHLTKHRPRSVFIGVELAPLPWLVSVIRARLQKSSALFLRNDYNDLDFTDYDVVFAYLSPAAMTPLWEKASLEMRPGTLLLSYEFCILERVPDIHVPTLNGHNALYGWRM